MTKLLAQADRIAESGAIVLLLGETGVGKELMARRIHRKSLRSNAPYVIVDTPTIPESSPGKRDVRPRKGGLHRS